jgi:hypothetical protein
VPWCDVETLCTSRTKRDKFVKQKAFCGEGNRHWSECLKNNISSLLHIGEDKFLNKLLIYMFFYLHCGRGFICWHRGRSKRCLISWSLCDNPENSFGQHKVPHHTWHIWISSFASRTPQLNTCNIGLSCDCCQASAYCDVYPVFRY